MRRLTHIGADGGAQMVDVSAKPFSARTAIAKGKIKLQRKTLDLIPLCHTLPLGDVKVDIVASVGGAEVTCIARTVAQTGVEMEALTGVTVALLTIYDMCKAVNKDMRISDVHLAEKTKSPVTAVYERRNQSRRRI